MEIKHIGQCCACKNTRSTCQHHSGSQREFSEKVTTNNEIDRRPRHGIGDQHKNAGCCRYPAGERNKGLYKPHKKCCPFFLYVSTAKDRKKHAEPSRHTAPRDPDKICEKIKNRGNDRFYKHTRCSQKCHKTDLINCKCLFFHIRSPNKMGMS